MSQSDSRKPHAPRVLGVKPGDMQRWEEHRYEDALVNMLFARYDLDRRIKYEMLDEYHQGTGERRLTLAAFNNKFPTFPIYLAARRFPNIGKESTVSKIFSNFADCQFSRAYVELEDVVPDEWLGPVGLIFNWPRLPGGPAKGLVLHNWTASVEVPGVRIVWVSPANSRFVVEPIQVMLAAMDRDCQEKGKGKKWQP